MQRANMLHVLAALLPLTLAVGCTDESPLATSKAGLTESAPLAPPRVQLPYQASWTTAAAPPTVFPGECGVLDPLPAFGIVGEGSGTHIGKATFVSISTVDDGPEPDAQKACAIITADNGDKLYVEIVGTATTEFPIISFSGVESFTGGTGRFRGASGSTTYEGTFNILAGTGQLTERGTIELQQGQGRDREGILR